MMPLQPLSQSASKNSEDCQSGVWAQHPLPSVYDDNFGLSGFANGSNLCSFSTYPPRTYKINLSSRSLVLMSLLSSKVGNAVSGIGTAGQLCGFNGVTGAATRSTASATCILILPEGTHDFHFCIASGTDTAKGSIVVMPND